MSELAILLVGDTDRTEFREARKVLDELGRVWPLGDVPSAIVALQSDQLAPDVIVFAQAFPGQFSPEAVDRLRRRAPLARILGLMGSWCEGEMRTGNPWPAAIRIYWHQWAPQLSREIGDLLNGTCSTWALPITASEEERFLLLADRPTSKREGLIAISTPLYDVQDWLSKACARRGYSTIWLQPHRSVRVGGVSAAILDADECLGEELRGLRSLADSLAPAPIIVLMDFPRVEDCRRALSGGAKAVLSKPLLVEDLFWQIDRLLDRSGSIHPVYPRPAV